MSNSKFFNKGISTPIGILIIVLVAIIAGSSILAYQYWWVPEEIETPQNETADWKTYRNEEYGFEVKYPKEWSVSETPEGILTHPYYKNILSEAMFCHREGAISETVWCGVLASVYQRPTDLSLREFYETKEKLFNFEIQNEEEFILGNQIHALKFIFIKPKLDESEVIVAIEKEGKIIEIKDKWGRSLGPEESDFTKTFNQMLSTFTLH